MKKIISVALGLHLLLSAVSCFAADNEDAGKTGPSFRSFATPLILAVVCASADQPDRGGSTHKYLTNCEIKGKKIGKLEQSYLKSQQVMVYVEKEFSYNCHRSSALLYSDNTTEFLARQKQQAVSCDKIADYKNILTSDMFYQQYQIVQKKKAHENCNRMQTIKDVLAVLSRQQEATKQEAISQKQKSREKAKNDVKYEGRKDGKKH